MKTRTFNRSAGLALALCAGALASVPACSGGCELPLFGQSHVFDAPMPSGCRTVQIPKKVDINRAADILFVIDNSGSMTEEQDNLARNASAYQQGGECDLALHSSAVDDLKVFMTTGAGRGYAPESWGSLPNGPAMKAIYDDCGFIERLQLYDNDFQIGIITTDQRDLEGFQHTDGTYFCPNNPPSFEFPGGRSPLPQRGCLQPIPGQANKIIRPSDGSIATISQRFRDAVRSVSVCGSPVEEGLGSIRGFLTASTLRADPSCSADLTQFLRPADCLKADGGACLTGSDGQPVPGPEKKLVVILLSDEEDCSNLDSPDGGPRTSDYTSAKECYTETQFLVNTSEYVGFLRSLKPEASLVSMAAIVGGNKTGPARGDFSAGDCRCNGSAANAAPELVCSPVYGNSIQARLCGSAVANQFCGTLTNSQLGDGGVVNPPCCTADRGNRYVAVARGMEPGNYILDSICAQTYKSTMIDIANLINETDVLSLGEVAPDPTQLVVEVKKSAGGDWEAIPPWTDRTSQAFRDCNGCTGDATQCSHGFAMISGCSQVKFLGSDIPPQGSEVRVSFLGRAADGAPKCR
ncbi:MAG: VWA domain-containing protein [Deltaproteobacteria bacterium]|nr:VWA domain-containing protein [Deltaproteobacteria bacterium]